MAFLPNEEQRMLSDSANIPRRRRPWLICVRCATAATLSATAYRCGAISREPGLQRHPGAGAIWRPRPEHR